MPQIHPTLPADGDDAVVEPYNAAINQILGVLNGAVDGDNLAPLGVTTAALAALAVTGAKIANNTIDITAKASVWDGWIAITDAWAFASATTINVPSDATTKFAVGDKIKFDNGSTKYFYITGITSTQLTVTGGSDYTVANSAITNVYYSKAETPQNFPQWFNFVPVWTNVTIGNAVVVARFIMKGKRVTTRVSVVWGSTTSASGSIGFKPPVNSATYAGTTNVAYVGYGTMYDVSAAIVYDTNVLWLTTVLFGFSAKAANGTWVTNAAVSSTSPSTWANPDEWSWNIDYESA